MIHIIYIYIGSSYHSVMIHITKYIFMYIYDYHIISVVIHITNILYISNYILDHRIIYMYYMFS